MATFNYNIVSYDFHTYFKLDNLEETNFAKNFKESIEKEFAEELSTQKARLFRTWDKPIGPHPDGFGMFESDTRSADTFLKLLNYYQLNHGNLSVLIHPRSGKGALTDHTKHALWLGERLPLKTHFLSDDHE